MSFRGVTKDQAKSHPQCAAVTKYRGLGLVKRTSQNLTIKKSFGSSGLPQSHRSIRAVSPNPNLRLLANLDREFLGGRSAAQFLRSVDLYLTREFFKANGAEKPGPERAMSARFKFMAEDAAWAILERARKAAAGDSDEFQREIWYEGVIRCGNFATRENEMRGQLIDGRITQVDYDRWYSANVPPEWTAMGSGESLADRRARRRREARKARENSEAVAVACD